MNILKSMLIGVFAVITCMAQSNSNSITIKDVDGNVYRTVKIGNQVWMAENLRTTKFNDGTQIPLVTDKSIWNDLKTHGYCYYNNTTNDDSIRRYGALYNWYTVDMKKLAPNGWHIPSEAEWQIMVDFLGGNGVAGGKMKSAGTIEENNGLWSQPNTEATNESGFSGNPGGGRFYVRYDNIDKLAYFWSSSEIDSNYCLGFYLHFRTSEIYHDQVAFKYNGLSVRCVMD